MMGLLSTSFIAVLALSAAASVDVPALAAGPSGLWEQVPCPFPDQVTLDGRSLKNELQPVCGRLTVPENYDIPDGRTITVAAMIVQSRDPNKKPDPVLFLSGGPGSYALSNWEYVIHEPLAVDLVGDRDWVIIDQRGVGRSSPLPCQGPRPSDEALTACRDEFTAAGVDLSQYNSRRSADDIEALRRALGVRQWHLHGISYGTRLAYTVARYYPDSVATMVLDAPFKPDDDATIDDAIGLETALRRLGAKCAEQPACAAAYPNVFDRFEQALARYDVEPGNDEGLVLDDVRMLSFVRTHFGYDGIEPFDRRAQETLQMMDAIARGDQPVVRRIVEAFESPPSPPAPPPAPDAPPPAPPAPPPAHTRHAFGMKWSVDCNEEKPFESLAAWRAAGQGRPIVKAALESLEYRFDICRSWPSGRADAVENTPVDWSGPQLVLSGELDPSVSGITGEEIAALYPHARNIVFRNAWHGQIKTGDVVPESAFNAYRMCAVGLARAFRNDPSAPLDARCAETRPLDLTPRNW